MQEHTKTISLSASKLSWDDVDRHAHSIGFKERSRYIQYLVEKDIFKHKIDFKTNFMIVILLILAIISLMILLKV